MTIVVAKKYRDKIVFWSDSLSSRDGFVGTVSKIYTIRGYTFGGAGLIAESQLMFGFLQQAKLKWKSDLNSILQFVRSFRKYVKHIRGNFDLDSSFLITHKGMLWHLFDNYQIEANQTEYVIGACWREYKTLRSTGVSIKSAIQSVIKDNIYCGGRIQEKVIKLTAK